MTVATSHGRSVLLSSADKGGGMREAAEVVGVREGAVWQVEPVYFRRRKPRLENTGAHPVAAAAAAVLTGCAAAPASAPTGGEQLTQPRVLHPMLLCVTAPNHARGAHL